MFNIVHIGGQEVPMLSMASVDYYYKNIFHEDPIKIQAADKLDAGDMVILSEKMGFVMAKFAELKDRKEMMKLNEDVFLDWMEKFDRKDLIEALPDIQATYEGQTVTGSKAKKNNTEQSAG